jgi:CheY-like chemotaxis protein
MVYIVDDDPAIQQALERLMRSAGLRAETFASVLDLLDKGSSTSASASSQISACPISAALICPQFLAQQGRHGP